MPTDNSMGNASVASNPNMNIAPPQTNINNEPNVNINPTGEEPNMDMENEDNIDMNLDMDVETNAEPNVERQKKEIQKNIGKACDDFRNYQGQDKEELSKWVEGMLDSILDDADNSGTNDEEGNDNETIPDDMSNEPTPQVESVIFTKGQLNNINEMIGIGNDEEEKKEQRKNEKKVKANNNTPFDNPKLNI